MPQALYRKYRPQTWDSVVGQQHVIETLQNALAGGRIAHAYLFAGPRGTGKTTTARLLAKAVNCLEEDLTQRPCGTCNYCVAVNEGRFLDLIEIDAASNTSVEDVRDLRDKVNYSPNQGRYKVYIIDEVHMLSTSAFNALLKTLEEPPRHVIFILATTEVHKIPLTVLSRCQRHEFRRIPVVEIVRLLEGIAEKEGIQVEKDALTLIARQSTGAMRDAISLLDQLASLGQVITLEKTQNVLGTAASQAVLDLIDALIDRAPDKGLDCLHAALDAGSDPRQLARQIVDYLRDLLLVRMEKGELIEATAEMRSLMGRHAQAFPVSALLRVIRLFNQAAGEARGMWQPSLPLEMAFIEALEAPAPTGEAPALPQQPKSSGQRPAPAASGVVPPHSVSQHASSYAQPAVSTGLDPATPPAMLYQTAATRAVVESAAKRQGLPPANRSLETSEKPAQPTREIDQNWQKLLGLTRKYNPKANGLLNSCKSHYLAEDTLILNFASDVISSQMEKPENMAAVQKALNDLYQENMNVRCCVDVTQRDAIPSGAENDGMVAAALRDLGGEVVDIQ